MTVYDLYIFETILHVKKFNTQKYSQKSHTYNLRNKRYVEPHKLQIFENKTTFIGTKFLYNLPKNIHCEEKYTSFKTRLKEYLLTHPIFSSKDFFNSRNVK